MATIKIHDLEKYYDWIQSKSEVTVKILLNARAFIINNAFSIKRDGRLLEATLSGNFEAFIYRIRNYW